MEALASQLERVPLERIKVTELAREAEVSKATFYLHYRDVFDLADAFVGARAAAVVDELGDPLLPMRDPRAFARRFVAVFTSEEQRRFIDVADRNHLAPLFMERLWRLMSERVEAAAPALGERVGAAAPAPGSEEGSALLAAVTRKGRVALAYTIGGMINAVQSNSDLPPDELEAMLAHLLANTLPDGPDVVQG